MLGNRSSSVSEFRWDTVISTDFLGRATSATAVSKNRCLAIACVALSAFHGVIGCVNPNATEPIRTVPSASDSRNKQASQKSPETELNPAALLAIEDFLDRTKDYQIDKDRLANSPVPKPLLPPGSSGGAAEMSGHSTKSVTSAPPPPVDSATAKNTGTTVANSHVAIEQTPTRPQPAVPVLQKLAIRSVDRDAQAVPSVEPATSSNRALVATPVDLGENPAERLVKHFAEAARNAGDFSTSWRLALLRSVLRIPAGAKDELPALSPEARGLGDKVRDVLVAVENLAGDPLSTDDTALESVERLKESLVDRMDPVVSTIALCRKVSTFGVFEPMAESDLVAGRSIQTIVYCELDRLKNEKTDKGQFRVSLSTRLDLFTEGGKLVWHQDEPQIEDVCRRPRSDFFVAHRITWPATLPSGTYALKVRVEDKFSGRTNEGTLSVTLSENPSVVRASDTKP